jgi:diguanylate cyclase (GGDEF)-like protein
MAKIASRQAQRVRLILLLSALLAGGFLATTLSSYFVSRDTVRHAITATELPLTSDNVYSEIQKDLIRPILISSMMARDTFLRDWVIQGEKEGASITRYLKEIQTQYNMFTSFFVSEHSRVYYQSEGILKKVDPGDDRDKWFFRVREMQEPYEINVDPDMAHRDKLTIFINYKVHDYKHQLIGVTGVGLDVDTVRNLIETYEARYGRKIFLTDDAGNIVLEGSSSADATLGTASSIKLMAGLGEIAQQMLTAETGSFTYLHEGHQRYINVRYIPELKWHLFVLTRDNSSMDQVLGALRINILLCIAITVTVLALVYLAIGRYQHQLEQMAITDSLTGVANRWALEEHLDVGVRNAIRQQAPLTIVLMDIDHFKTINDTHGHLAGDHVLKRFAEIIAQQFRSTDIVCRWGGEEFLVLLTQTDKETALQLTTKLRSALKDSTVWVGSTALYLTISAGIATYRAGETVDHFLARADALLYAAKDGGRNRVECEPVNPT